MAIYLHDYDPMAIKYNLPVKKEFFGDKLVAYDDLPEEAKEEIGRKVFLILADGLMGAQGYTRVEKQKDEVK